MNALEALDRQRAMEVYISREMKAAACEAVLAYNRMLKKSGGFPSKLPKRTLERIAYEARIWDLEHFTYKANPQVEQDALSGVPHRSSFGYSIPYQQVSKTLNTLLKRVATEMRMVAPMAFRST